MDERVLSQVATKEDLNQLRRDLENFATKEDLEKFATKEELERFATKEDLERFATKEDIANFATKDDLERFTAKEEFNLLKMDVGQLKEDVSQLREEFDDFKNENFNRLDQMMVILKKLDQERFFTFEAQKRLENTVETHEQEIGKIKKHIGLA